MNDFHAVVNSTYGPGSSHSNGNESPGLVDSSLMVQACGISEHGLGKRFMPDGMISFIYATTSNCMASNFTLKYEDFDLDRKHRVSP